MKLKKYITIGEATVANKIKRAAMKKGLETSGYQVWNNSSNHGRYVQLVVGERNVPTNAG